MGLEVHRVVDDSGLVREHELVFRSGGEFPSSFRPFLDDRLCRIVEYFVIDE